MTPILTRSRRRTVPSPTRPPMSEISSHADALAERRFSRKLYQLKMGNFDFQIALPMIKMRKCLQDCKYCLTRMMDCRKPSAGFIDNMKPDLLKDGMKARSRTDMP